MRNRILKTLEAYLLINEDFLEEDQVKDLKEQIEAVKNYEENFFMRLFKKLRFCKHNYEKIDFYERIEYGIRYSVRVYKCSKCGKEIYVDGRKDRCAR